MDFQPVQNELCTTCNRFVKDVDQDQSFTSKTWREIQEAKDSCNLCRLVYDFYAQLETQEQAISNIPIEYYGKERLRKFKPRPVDSDRLRIQCCSPLSTWLIDHIPKGFSSRGEQCANWLQIQVDNGNNKSLSLSDPLRETLYLYPVAPPQNSEEEMYFMGRLLGSPQVDFNVIKGWLKRCDGFHPLCDWDPGDEVDDLMLVDVDSLTVAAASSPSVQYTALSYRWGNAIQHPVDSDGRLPSQIPATIEDAILVTKSLGIKYLWVDVYCVPQEESERKRIALGNMGTIYRNSTITIVAPFGDAAAGLPGVRENLRPTQQAFGSIDGQLVASVPNSDNFEQPWNGWRMRSWTYQEAALSRRNLFFGLTKMYFECNTECFSECLAEPWTMKDPITGQKNIKLVQIKHGLVEYHFPTPSRGVQWTLEMYRLLLLEYTRRKLSRLSDRLDALLGIMNDITANCGVTFFFGLPEVDFIDALLWVDLRGGRCIAEKSTSNDFPSWSWARCPGATQTFEKRLRPIATLSKVSRSGEIGTICSSSDELPSSSSSLSLSDLGHREKHKKATSALQNDSMRFYEPFLLVEAETSTAFLRVTAASMTTKTINELFVDEALQVPILSSRFESWGNVNLLGNLTGALQVELMGVGMGAADDVAMMCLQSRGVDGEYIALGWLTLTRQVWDGLDRHFDIINLY